MGCEDSANDVLVDVETEGQGNLLGNAWASPTWIALLHFNNGTNQIRAWAFRSRPRSAFCGKQKPVFSMNQSAMKVEKRRWFHHDCGSYQSFRQQNYLSLIHISEPTRRTPISYAVFCLKKKKQ